MSEPITINVHTLLDGQVYWSTPVKVVEGSEVKVHTDQPLAALNERVKVLTEFIEKCAGKAGTMVDGTKLAKAANDVLGRGVEVEGGAT